MANVKAFNSKNLSAQVENLFKIGKVDLAMDILRSEELKNLLPNILSILRRKSQKTSDYNQTKIFSKTDVDKDVLNKLQEALKLDVLDSKNSAKIIIDENLSPGVKIKSKDLLVDATLETMLEDALNNLHKN